MEFLDKKAGWQHYAVTFLAILGLWYLVAFVHGGGGSSKASTPLTNTTVDLSSMVVFAS
jgi:hypothetical protein